MATSDNVSLLSKVASFVGGQTPPKFTPSDGGQAATEAADKVSMQAMMDRRLHNDIVRKREFAMLRQMRKREPKVGNIDVNDRGSLFQSSMLTQPGGRAQTIKKIDEIEQQMSQQWWKGKQIKGAFSPKPSPPAAAPSVAEAPTQAVIATTPATPAPSAKSVDTGLDGLEPSLYDEPQPSASEGFQPTFQPTQADQFVHDPQIEDAAILFANGDFEGAGQILLNLMAASELQAQQEKIWMTLLDLYRASGDRKRFDSAGIDFAAQFGRSAPQWSTAIEVEPLPLPATVMVTPGGQVQQWISPPTLGPAALAQLKTVLSKATTPWLLNWSQLTRVEEAVLPEIEGLFAGWCKSGLQLRFVGTRHLEELLRANTTTGDAGIRAEWWLWRLNYLRLAGMEDDFETVALDYCITYEMSPPDWEPPLCSFCSSELDATQADDETPVLVVSEELLSTRSGEFSSTRQGALEFSDGFAGAGPVSGGARFGHVELSNNLLGDASAAIEKMDRGRSGFSKVIVDCRHLGRVDFLAAGDLLNWTAARSAEGCKVEFRNLNRLVATFFSVIGIDEFARIIPPAH